MNLPTYRVCHDSNIELISNMSIYHLLAAFEMDVSFACKRWFDTAAYLALFNVEEFCSLPPPHFFTDHNMLRALQIQMDSMEPYKTSRFVWSRFGKRIKTEYALLHCWVHQEMFDMGKELKEYPGELYDSEGKHKIGEQK